MLISLLLNIANLLGELLNGVFVCAVLHLKVCDHFSVSTFVPLLRARWRHTLLLFRSCRLCRHDWLVMQRWEKEKMGMLSFVRENPRVVKVDSSSGARVVVEREKTGFRC